MSGSNRGGPSTLGLAEQQDAGRQGQTAQGTAENNQPNATSNKNPAPLITDAPAIVTSATDSRAEREYYRAEEDLRAQQDMAFYALLMFIASLLTVVVTAIGVWFVKRTLDATLEAVEDTGKATNAMVRQNELTELSQRPWIAVEVFPKRLGLKDGFFAFEANANFTNLGPTAATSANIAVTSHFVIDSFPEEFGKILADYRAKLQSLSSGHIVPNETAKRLLGIMKKSSDIPFIEKDGKRSALLMVVATVQYRSAIRPGEWLETSRAFLLKWRDKGGFTHSSLYDAPILLGDDRLILEPLHGEVIT